MVKNPPRTALLMALAAVACSEHEAPATAPATARAIQYVVTANVASVLAGTQVTILARLADAQRNSVAQAGDVVTWTSTGGGSFATPTSTTDGNGVATVLFTASATPGTAHTIAATDGSGLRGTSGEIVANAPVTRYAVSVSATSVLPATTITVTAQLVDVAGVSVPVSDRVVTWTSTNGGSFSAPTSTTNATGVATVVFTTTIVPGVTQVVTATDTHAPSWRTTNPGVSPSIGTTGMQLQGIAGGFFHTCGLKADGSAYCWGQDGYGQLGDGGGAPRLTPVMVAGGLAFRVLTIGDFHTCGLTLAGTAYCWGSTNGQALRTPAPAAGDIRFLSLAAGLNYTCGITTDSTAYCWGDNTYGQLGAPRDASGRVSSQLKFVQITAGFASTCAVATTGAVYCWGLNDYGQLGDGTTTNRAVPAQVLGGVLFRTVGSEGAATCALTPAGAAYCWGINQYFGNLGDGTLVNSTRPVRVAGGLTFDSLSVSRSQACGLTSGHAAYCWGASFGGQNITPRLIGTNFQSVAAGNAYACAVTITGGAFCWGANDNGQLGDNTTIGRFVPVAVWP